MPGGETKTLSRGGLTLTLNIPHVHVAPALLCMSGIFKVRVRYGKPNINGYYSQFGDDVSSEWYKKRPTYVEVLNVTCMCT